MARAERARRRRRRNGLAPSTTTPDRGARSRRPEVPPLTPESAEILARWAGLAADVEAAPELDAVFQAFHERVQRLYAIDVESVEFDFLRPMD